MANLLCKANSCTHNKSDCCCKGDIMVGGKQVAIASDTCCNSFSTRCNDSFTSAIEHPSHIIQVDCEVENCTHNMSCKCCADQVEITGVDACECRQTSCSTFQES